MESAAEGQTPLEYVDQLAQIEQVTHAELARIERAYAEIQRRDGAAEQRVKQWRTVALVAIVALFLTSPVIAYLATKASQVQAYVQPVQITEEGRMVLIGVPQDLLAYEPENGHWMELVEDWTKKKRWRGDEVNMKRTTNDIDWLLRHSCGLALAQLQKEIETEGLLKPTKIRTSVGIRNTLKTQTPTSFQVNFREVTQDAIGGQLKESDWIGTFTVGRVKPKTMEQAQGNRLGLCVSGYGFAPSHVPAKGGAS